MWKCAILGLCMKIPIRWGYNSLIYIDAEMMINVVNGRFIYCIIPNFLVLVERNVLVYMYDFTVGIYYSFYSTFIISRILSSL